MLLKKDTLCIYSFARVISRMFKVTEEDEGGHFPELKLKSFMIQVTKDGNRAKEDQGKKRKFRMTFIHRH